MVCIVHGRTCDRGIAVALHCAAPTHIAVSSLNLGRAACERLCAEHCIHIICFHAGAL
jgi:hypothetical protein